jgi:TPP-dependent pyruvate/acetoin dehydrogenase alpha subunit
VRLEPFTEEPIGLVNADGSPAGKWEPADLGLDEDGLKSLYRWLVLTRAVDDRGLILVKQGRAGFFAQSAGQEAAMVGSAAPLRSDDWIFPAHRELGVCLVAGMSTADIFGQILGRTNDPAGGRQMPSHLGKGGDLRVVPPSSVVGSQIPQAAGVALGIKIRGGDQVVACYFGDGATSEGDFHVGLNCAGVYRLPAIFVCQNNQYAISIGLSGQTASKNIAVKAVAYGFDGYLVDGQDVLAVHGVARQVAGRAREGRGPALLELLTYRYGPHSSADDDKRYRTREELDEWRQRRDPLRRMRRYLGHHGLWDDDREAELAAECKRVVDAGLAVAEAAPEPGPETIADHTFARPYAFLTRQKEALLAELEASR